MPQQRSRVAGAAPFARSDVLAFGYVHILGHRF